MSLTGTAEVISPSVSTVQSVSVSLTEVAEDVEEDVELTALFKSLQAFDRIRLDQTVTVDNDDTRIRVGPIDLLMDTPLDLGCFRKWSEFDETPSLATPSNVTPASCLVACFQVGKRFAGIE